MATFKSIAQHAPVIARYQQTAAAGTAPPGFVYVNPTGSNEYFEIAEVRYIYDVVGSTSAAADLKVCPSATAMASGVTALVATMDLTATARTPRKASVSGTASARAVKPGDSLAIVTSGTLTGLTGLVIEVVLKPIKIVKTH